MRKLKIAEAIAPKWKDVARLIGVSNPKIANIEHPGSGKTPEQCSHEVLTIWQEISNNTNDYTYSWNGLFVLVQDIEMDVLAEDLKGAISCQQSTVRGSLTTEKINHSTTTVIGELSY